MPKICKTLQDLGVSDWVIIHARDAGYGLAFDGVRTYEETLKLMAEHSVPACVSYKLSFTTQNRRFFI